MNELFPIYESLAKLVAYIDDQPGFREQVQGFLNTTGYQIDRTFDDPVTGFHAIGLVSTTPNKPPVLLFRGTDTLADDATLIDKRGIGLRQIEANRDSLRSWLTEINQDSTKNPSRFLADLLGHSLGGALSQTAAAEFTSLIGDVVTFNSPGVSQSTVDQFRQNGGLNKNVTHFVVNGDLVSLNGEAFIPGTVEFQSFSDSSINPLLVLPGSPLNPIDKHTRRDLLTNPPPNFSQREISIDELNAPTFAYTSDPNYNEFTAALSTVLPQFAIASLSRSGVESIRTLDGASFFGLVGQLAAALDFAQSNLLVGDDRNNIALGLDLNDTIQGNHGDDILNGNRGNDIVDGGAGNDTLFGGKDSDTLLGGNGNDLLSGDLGNDALSGGAGNDRFILAAGKDADTILDFSDGQDLLVLSGGLTFAQLTISSSNNNTLIAITSTGEVLATLVGVSVGAISASDFG